MYVAKKNRKPMKYKTGIPLEKNNKANNVDIILEYAASPSNSSPV